MARKFINRNSIVMLAICLLCAVSKPVFADTTEANILVTATDKCLVELKGVSDNTNGYLETKQGNKSIDFSLAFNEPGEYQYEMRQVESGSMHIYDKTVYNVWVTVLYENDKMQTVVTGGIANTDDKPDEFKFSKKTVKESTSTTSTPTPNKSVTKDSSATMSNVETGDTRNLLPWLAIIALSALAAAMTHAHNRRVEK